MKFIIFNAVFTFVFAILLLIFDDKYGYWNFMTVSSIYTAAALIVLELRK